MEDRFSLDDFELYQIAREFRKRLYRLLKALPKAETYCLGTQMRRVAVSITNNIAEGHGRWHYLENIHFLRISRGSVDEAIDDLNTCIDEEYAPLPLLTAMKSEGKELIRRINGYISYLRKRKQQDE